METTQTAGRARRKRIWLYITGLALLILACAIYPASNFCKFLVDRYAEPPLSVDTSRMSELTAAFLTVSANNSLRNPDSRETISPAEWQQLRDRFGLTPQFALASINFNCTRWDGSTNSRERPFAVELMYNAYKSGATDFPLLLRLYINRERWNWTDEHPRPGFTSQVALNDIDIAKLWRKHCPAPDSPQGKLERQLLREMRKRAPDQALPFYLEAIQCCREGRTADAQRFLKLGNAAPKCDFPAGPPFDEVWAEASQGRAIGGDPALIVISDLHALSLWDSYSLALNQASIFLAAAATDENNPEVLSDLNVALCRIADAPPVGFWQRREISQGFKQLREAAYDCRAITWTSERLSAFDRYRERVESLDLTLGGLVCGTAPDHSLDQLDALSDRFTHGRSSQAICMAAWRDSGRETIAECQAVVKNNPPILRELQRFDFVNMNWRNESAETQPAGE